MHDFRTDRLRAFVAVARQRGFTRGARALGRSQSSVSQAVSLLEDELGEPLLVRDGRSVRVTAAGALLLVRAERAFAELEAAEAEIAALRGLESGRLTLGTSDTLAIYLLPPVFACFRERHPGVELKLVNRPSPALAEQVAARQVDLAVASLPLPKSLTDPLRVEVLSEQRDVLICRPDHALASRDRVSLASLADHPLLLLDRSTGTRAVLDARFAKLGVEPNIVMEMSSVEVLKRLVELGFGASIVPAMAAQREVANGSLMQIEIRGLGRARQVGILTPTAGPLSPAASAFVAIAHERL